MPDNWGYVAAAYGLAVLVLGGYWRHLVRRERELAAAQDRRARIESLRPPSNPAPRSPLP
jgi:hypothetical protein